MKINPGRPKAEEAETPTVTIILLTLEPQDTGVPLLSKGRNHRSQDPDSCWKRSLPPEKRY